MVRNKYQEQLVFLKELIGSFGEMTGRIFRDSMKSVLELDVELAQRTLDLEPGVDELERAIEVSTFELLALQQPLAGDLRFVISGLKVTADLRRIAGLSINIAKIPGKIEGEHIKPLVDTKKMADIAGEMLSKSLRAFEGRDSELARETATLDNGVDELFYKVWVELIEMMAKDPGLISRGTYVLFLIRYLERIADHCCNVCEDTVYLATAERVKLN